MYKKNPDSAVVVGAVVAVLLVAAAISLGMSYLLMVAWNYVMPEVFGLRALTYWQAFALMFIANLLFNAIRGSWRRA